MSLRIFSGAQRRIPVPLRVNALHLADEVVVKAFTAVFAVGDALQAGVLLQLYSMADVLVLVPTQLGKRNLFLDPADALVKQGLGAKQAADVVGAERGFCPGGHE